MTKPLLTFNFIGVAVVNWQPAFELFHEKLGIRAETNPDYGDWANLGGAWEAYNGGSRSAIFELFDGGRAVSERAWGVNQGIRPAFHVHDIDKAIATLEAKIIPVYDKQQKPYGTVAEFKTIEGIRFALAHLPYVPASDDFELPYIGHVAIRCADFEAMQQFYGDVIGFNSADQRDDLVVYEQHDNHPKIILEAGGQPMTITDWAGDVVRACPVFLSMMTGTIDTVYQHFKQSNVSILRAIKRHDDWGGTDFHVADPDGNRIQIVQYH